MAIVNHVFWKRPPQSRTRNPTTSSASTPKLPIWLSFMAANLRSLSPLAPKPSAKSAQPSSCRAPVAAPVVLASHRAVYNVTLVRASQRDGVRTASAKLLTTRQGRILELSLAGWTVQQIAGKLETPAPRISDEKYKAIRKLGRHLQLI